MDWGDVVANVEGTYEDEHLVFTTARSRRSNGAPFVLNDRKDVQIVGDDMVGTERTAASASARCACAESAAGLVVSEQAPDVGSRRVDARESDGAGAAGHRRDGDAIPVRTRPRGS